MSVILATQQAETGGSTFKPVRANSSRDPLSKKPFTKKGLVEWLKV
jgi:hypothetical protein